MQKIVNVIALLSGLVSLGVVGGGTYLYLNKDAMLEDVRAKATEEITKTITESLPGMIQGAMPKMPSATGNVIDSKPGFTGGAIPLK